MRRLSIGWILPLAALVAACGVNVGPQAASVRDLSGSGALGRVHKPGELSLSVLPEAGDKLVLNALASAKRVIRLQMYLLTHQGVMDALIAAKKRGVEVQVLLEPEPYNPGNPNSPLPTNKKAAEYLAKGGVVVHWTSSDYNFTHAKAFTIDDAITYVSTANFTRSGLGLGAEASREYIIADRSPSDVAEFVAMYQADWNHQAYAPSDDDLVVSPTNARSRILGLIDGAKSDLVLASEVAGDPELSEHVAAKIRQGVKVRALLGQHKSRNPNDKTAAAWAAAGAQVRFQSAPFLHAKAVIADGQRMYIGSINLTRNSMDKNRELGLMVLSPDIIAGVKQTTERDWAAAEPFSP